MSSDTPTEEGTENPTSSDAPVPPDAATADETPTTPTPVGPSSDAVAAATGGFESGQIVSGPATAVTSHEVEIDLGEGRVGVVGSRHWAPGLQVDLTGEVAVGDEVEAAVLVREDQRGRIVLSRSWARTLQAWEALAEARASGDIVEAVVLDKVKGGLAVDAGIRAFVPASLIDTDQGFDADQLVGTTIECRVVDVDQRKGRCVLSRKAVQRSQRREESRAHLESLRKGQELTGRVVRLADFGAFVDVGHGLHGLVHRSELGWQSTRDPADVVSVGDEVQVAVLKVQPDKMRLGLTMRRGPDPLSELEVGQRVDATVSRLVDFGAFVRLPGGVEGLVHLSEMAEYRVNHPEEVVLPGEPVRVEVLAIDRRRRRVDLSIRLAVVPDLPAAVPGAPAAPETDEPADESSEPAAEQNDEPADENSEAAAEQSEKPDAG